MARLTPNSIAAMQDSGKWLARLAAEVAVNQLESISEPTDIEGQTSLSQSRSNEFVGFFNDKDSIKFGRTILSAALELQSEALSDTDFEEPPVPDGDRVLVQFHFDRTFSQQGQSDIRIVNIVVPDFTGKAIAGNNNVVTYNLNDVAEETFGFTILARCEN